MNLQIETDDILQPGDDTRFAVLLGCDATELPDRLTGVLAAAFADYAEMMLGLPLPNPRMKFSNDGSSTYCATTRRMTSSWTNPRSLAALPGHRIDSATDAA